MNYPAFFNSEGVPARIMSANDVPEIYAGNGNWKPYPDRFDIMHSTPIEASDVKSLCEKFDAAQAA